MVNAREPGRKGLSGALHDAYTKAAGIRAGMDPGVARGTNIPRRVFLRDRLVDASLKFVLV
jgi:hypothetical protein